MKMAVSSRLAITDLKRSYLMRYISHSSSPRIALAALAASGLIAHLKIDCHIELAVDSIW
jgi:hypothetical protein